MCHNEVLFLQAQKMLIIKNKKSVHVLVFIISMRHETKKKKKKKIIYTYNHRMIVIIALGHEFSN